MSPSNEIDHGKLRDITIAKVKACPAFKHLTDNQAVEVMESIKELILSESGGNKKETPTIQSSETIIKGYRVKVEYNVEPDEVSRRKRDCVLKVIADSTRRRK